ncbi:MAG: hypothetical protein RMM98_04965 [Acidobacteriota bacterium]|nr:hypothetical protein [Blastocatellia bacterium]MDW8238944.1 hypothetical protein [Acidobacteriota bacterium]
MTKYDYQIRVRGRPWYQLARRVPGGYELDPAENRGFALQIPYYMVIEEIPLSASTRPSSDSFLQHSLLRDKTNQ